MSSDRRNELMRISILIAAAILIIFGLRALWISTWVLSTYESRDYWQAVEGRIISAKPTGGYVTTDRLGNTMFYAVEVEYAYAVNGTRYVGNRIGPVVRRVNTKDHYASRQASYHQGQVVTVHYDPEAPENALLYIPPDSGGYAITLLLGALAVAGAIALALNSGKLSQQRR